MYLLLQLKLFSLLFVIILCDKMHYECEKIDQKDSLQYSWSMVVSIRYDCHCKDDLTTHCCSGIIVSESYILTTADCIDNFRNDITIAAGIYNRTESEQIIRKVDQIIIHPNWTNDRDTIKYNIALLHLSNPLDFTVNKHITRACSLTYLNLSEDVLKYLSDNSRLWVLEWNSTGKNVDDITSANLQQTELSLVSHNDPICNGLIYDAEQQFCARFYRTNKSSFEKKIYQ
jgi:secreted trypsin-like serine protease